MLGLIQRVSQAQVTIEGETAGSIERGLVLLLGIQKDDTTREIRKLLDKVIAYRVFPDEAGHMNRSLVDVGGGLLVVSQFTLPADTKKGLRPSFSSAAPPDMAEGIYDEFVEYARSKFEPVETGRFGANMQVHLVNDGPVTFLLEA